MNTGARLSGLDEAQQRVLDVQRKLHEWASDDAERRFRDLWNLVCDPAYEHDVQKRIPSVDKAKRVLGFEATTSLSEMLDEVIPWVAQAIEDGSI